jgi:hypothetical protein
MRSILTAAAIVLLALLPAYGNGIEHHNGEGGEGPGPVFGGWVYAPYTTCHPPQRECVISVAVDGVNLRQQPNGFVVLALANGTPLTVYTGDHDWVYVGVMCDLVPTGLWSWTAGVPLYGCAW